MRDSRFILLETYAETPRDQIHGDTADYDYVSTTTKTPDDLERQENLERSPHSSCAELKSAKSYLLFVSARWELRSIGFDRAKLSRLWLIVPRRRARKKHDPRAYDQFDVITQMLLSKNFQA